MDGESRGADTVYKKTRAGVPDDVVANDGIWICRRRALILLSSVSSVSSSVVHLDMVIAKEYDSTGAWVRFRSVRCARWITLLNRESISADTSSVTPLST